MWTERGEILVGGVMGRRSRLFRKPCVLWLGRNRERSGKEKLQTVSKTGSESKRKGMEKLRQSEIKSVPVVA